MKTTQMLLLIPLIALFTACGGGGDDTPKPFDPFASTWTSPCQDNGGTGFKYFVSFDAAQSTFIGNSASGYASADCTGRIGRSGRNILQGTYTIGNAVTASGVSAVQADFVYSTFTQANRTAVTPADFDLVYVDPTTNNIHLGLKTASRPGTSAGNRPNQIDFSYAWTPS